MVSSTDMLAAVRELSNTKQLDRAELHALLQDGIMAALAKKYGANVQAEVDIDEGKGEIRIVLLKTVVETVEDASKEISLDDARTYDESFEPGDVLEEPVVPRCRLPSSASFNEFAKASEPRSATSSRRASANCFLVKYSRSSAASWS
jgi:hypothetical protein